MNRVALCLLVSLVPSPTFAQACEESISELRWLDTAVALDDATAALEKGNKKYMAVLGYGVKVPGLEIEQVRDLQKRDYVVIQGTSDDWCSDEHFRLNMRAAEYAEAYNRTILGGG